MACCLCGAKPLPQPMLTCCQLNPEEQHGNLHCLKKIHFRKIIYKMSAIFWRPLILKYWPHTIISQAYKIMFLIKALLYEIMAELGRTWNSKFYLKYCCLSVHGTNIKENLNIILIWHFKLMFYRIDIHCGNNRFIIMPNLCMFYCPNKIRIYTRTHPYASSMIIGLL